MGSQNSTKQVNGYTVPADYNFEAQKKFEKLYKLDLKPIGQGAFSTVFKGESLANPDLKVALKAVCKQNISKDIVESIYNENKVLMQLDHPNIVNYFDTYEDEVNIFIVTKFIEGTPLSNRVVAQNYNEEQAKEIVYQIVSAVYHCHEQGIAHRDIKPENVIIDGDGQITLIDFGLSKSTSAEAVMKTCAGTPMFMAPEVLKEEYNLECDIWSLGILIYNVLAGFIPCIRDLFGDKDDDPSITDPDLNLIFKFSQFAEISDEAKDLLRHMIVLKPEKRYTAKEVLEHPWFDSLSKDDIEDEKVDSKILTKLKSFKCESMFKRGLLNMLINMVHDEKKEDKQHQFDLIDISMNMMISKEDLVKAFKASKTPITDSEASDIITNIDFTGNGVINYTDFLAATLDYSDMCNTETTSALFLQFDKDQKGHITKEDIQREFDQIGKEMSDEELDQVMALHKDEQNDGITYDHFLKIIDA